MKRYVAANSDFSSWYRLLSYDKRKEVDEFARHNLILPYDEASDNELEWVMNECKSMFYDRESELLNDSDRLLEEIRIWASTPTRKFKKFELGQTVYLEKHSIQDMINGYIRYFNENVRDYGYGFETDWDSDDWMDILYKNGKIRTINPDCDDGKKRISVDGIDSIILNGGWGTAFAGPSIKFEDYTQYEGLPDIRVEFDV